MTAALTSSAHVAALVTSSGALLLERVETADGTALRLPVVPEHGRGVIEHVRARFDGELSRLRRIMTVGAGAERVTVWGARLVGHAPGRWPDVPSEQSGLGSRPVELVPLGVDVEALTAVPVWPAAAHDALVEVARSGRLLEVFVGARAVRV